LAADFKIFIHLGTVQQKISESGLVRDYISSYFLTEMTTTASIPSQVTFLSVLKIYSNVKDEKGLCRRTILQIVLDSLQNRPADQPLKTYLVKQ